jgi:alpha-L-glutamate ligase-like protein
MFSWLKRVKNSGVLGINARNACYISIYNQRKLYPLADDKLRTKLLLSAEGVPVPKLLGQITRFGEISGLEQQLAGLSEFVVKPNHGSGGEGIVVVTARSGEFMVRANGELMDYESFRYHVSGILHGLYSLGGQPDSALIETRVQCSSVFEEIAVRGVPDIRVIVFLGSPVMAMLRLPTERSRGRANLHQGAVGAGVDIDTGITNHGVFGSSSCDVHPDTGCSITGFQIPEWGRIVDIAVQCQKILGLGYLGVDIVIDQHLGPQVLEVNARPGLAIQIANRSGLRKRLRAVEDSALRDSP